MRNAKLMHMYYEMPADMKIESSIGSDINHVAGYYAVAVYHLGDMSGYIILDSTLARDLILLDNIAITDLLDQHDADVGFEMSKTIADISIMLGENMYYEMPADMKIESSIGSDINHVAGYYAVAVYHLGDMSGYIILDSTLARDLILLDDIAITDLLDQHDADVGFEVSKTIADISYNTFGISLASYARFD
jgi:hypothetical protein